MEMMKSFPHRLTSEMALFFWKNHFGICKPLRNARDSKSKRTAHNTKWKISLLKTPEICLIKKCGLFYASDCCCAHSLYSAKGSLYESDAQLCSAHTHTHTYTD